MTITDLPDDLRDPLVGGRQAGPEAFDHRDHRATEIYAIACPWSTHLTPSARRRV